MTDRARQRGLPPPVVYPVGRSPVLALSLVLLALAAAAGPVFLTWGGHALRGGPSALAVAWGLWALAALALWAWWQRQPTGWLSWRAEGVDGWSWSGPQGLCAVPLQGVRAVLWLNRVVVVQVLVPQGPAPRWLWLEARTCPARWLALRRALLAPAWRPPLRPEGRAP